MPSLCARYGALWRVIQVEIEMVVNDVMDKVGSLLKFSEPIHLVGLSPEACYCREKLNFFLEADGHLPPITEVQGLLNGNTGIEITMAGKALQAEAHSDGDEVCVQQPQLSI